MTFKEKMTQIWSWLSPAPLVITVQAPQKVCVTCEEVKAKKHLRTYLDQNIYNFALKMQELIKSKQVSSSDYTSRDLEKIDEDIATINAQYVDGNEFTDFDVKVAARMFLLNNQLN